MAPSPVVDADHRAGFVHWRRLLAACLAWLALTATASALELHQLDPAVGDAPPERVLSGSLDDHFLTRLPHEVVLPPSRDRRWLRIDLAAAEAGTGRLLTIGRLPMRVLDVWLPTADGGFEHQARSFFEPDPGRFTPSAFVFELPPGLQRSASVYLRVDHGGRLLLSVAAPDYGGFLRREQRFEASVIAAGTAVAVMLLVNLVFAVALRDRLYGHYVAFLGAQLAWVLFASGIAFALPGGHWLGQYPGSLSGALVTLANAVMLAFARQFADLPARHPRFDRALRGLSLVFIALALAFILPVELSQRWIGAAASAVFALLPLLLLAAMVRAWLAGSRPAALFLLAWLPLGVFGGWRTAIGLGLAPPSTPMLYAPLFAVAFESIVLSLALAWRMLQLRIERDRARYFADYDAMTGGYSRRAGEQRLRGMIERHAAAARALSIVFFDLDHLKVLNDAHGHAAGDACLRTLGERVRTQLAGRGDLVRWGGDEFVVLLPDATAAQAAAFATQLVAAVRAAPVEVAGLHLPLAISAGVASASPGDRDVVALVERADQALYEAKRQGRDRVIVAAPPRRHEVELPA